MKEVLFMANGKGDRPAGRRRIGGGTGKSVNTHGQGLGTGPVGKQDAYAGRRVDGSGGGNAGGGGISGNGGGAQLPGQQFLQRRNLDRKGQHRQTEHFFHLKQAHRTPRRRQ